MHSFFRVVAALALTLTTACGGGSNTPSPSPAPDPAPPPPAPEQPQSGCSVSVVTGADEQVWPSNDWLRSTPELQGLCPDALNEARDYAFAVGNRTGAFVVVKNGYIVYEAYQEGRSPHDLLTSWSVAKSLASMLIGTALDDENLPTLDEAAARYITPWQDSPKSAITLRHLMRLRTALEEVDAGDLYAASNQLQISIDRELIGNPGEQHSSYSNADVMLAGEVIRVATRQNADFYLKYRVGDRIGMTTTEWWIDAEENVLTYCCLDATAEDFARFGLLYARGGEWNGDRVISTEWVAESTQPARDGIYGFYWWPLTHDGFAAFGLNSQIIAIYPNYDLVILRFSEYSRAGDGRAVREGTNFHNTPVSLNFNNATFLDTALESLDVD